jgi:hypothetical protein
MPNKTDQVVGLLTDVAGAVGDVEKTLQTAPSHEKKAAAMAALKDAVNIAAKQAPEAEREQITSAAGKAVDLVVELKNVFGLFKRHKRHAIPATKSA